MFSFSAFSQQIKQLLGMQEANLQAKEIETKAWKIKYNIQTQQERELQRAQAQEVTPIAASSPSPPTGVLA
jgi:hypothetical protein